MSEEAVNPQGSGEGIVPGGPAAVPTNTPTPTEKPESTGTDEKDIFSYANPETPEEGTPTSEGDLILGKYKDQAALEEGYKQLEKAYRSKDNIAPEEYAFDDILKETGLTFAGTAEGYQDKFVKDLRENNFTQSQTEFMLRLGNDWLRGIQRAQGLKADPESIFMDLMQGDSDNRGWGDKQTVAKKLETISGWARGKFHANVVNALKESPEGIRFLEMLRTNETGLSPITDNTDFQPALSRADDLRAEIRKRMDDPESRTNSLKGRQLNEEIDKLMMKLDAMGESIRPKQ